MLSAFRGYALIVWAMVTLLTRRSHFGTRVVELAVAAGGVLIAVAVFVPAMPLAFTLAGVLLLLAGLTAGALLTRQARGVGGALRKQPSSSLPCSAGTRTGTTPATAPLRPYGAWSSGGSRRTDRGPRLVAGPGEAHSGQTLATRYRLKFFLKVLPA